MKVHMIGVGGSGMSAVAHLLGARGYEVTGSDQAPSKYFRALVEVGYALEVGHDPRRVEGVDAVVVSTAIKPTNVELARARELGITVWHRSEALAHAVADQRVIAVAGSHGKTTTAALVTHMLHSAGLDASAAVGAALKGMTGAVAGGYAGSATITVVEADESDGSFLRFRPEVGIVTNIEPDHMDFYGTTERLHEAFQEFMAGCALVVACADDRVVREVARRSGRDILWYGTAGRDDHSLDLALGADLLTWGDLTVPWQAPMPGEHYRLNAAAALAAAVTVGADRGAAADALRSFGGTGRRFELRERVGGIEIIDDYAHHPTEVAALLAGAREGGAGHLVVLFEPMLFTRTQAHAAAFGQALSVTNADVVVAPVHGDREDPIPGVSSESIVEAIEPGTARAHRARSLEDAARIAAEVARSDSTVLTVGSGPVTTMAPVIAAHLRSRHGSDV